MADLLGGTTGQVLSKASNTDMDFSWVAQDDSNAIQNAIVDAKGDLIAASAADTPARLAVGTSGYVLSPNSGETTGLKWQPAGNWHGAYVVKTTSQTLSNDTQTLISFDNEVSDTDGYHDNTTNNNRLTVPAGLGGVYAVTGTINFDPSATGVRYVIVRKNGNIFFYAVLNNAGGGAETMFQTTQIIPLAAGDYVELMGIQTSGGNLTIKGGQTYYTNFSLFLIGV
jgi:hypothetical protein